MQEDESEESSDGSASSSYEDEDEFINDITLVEEEDEDEYRESSDQAQEDSLSNQGVEKYIDSEIEASKVHQVGQDSSQHSESSSEAPANSQQEQQEYDLDIALARAKAKEAIDQIEKDQWTEAEFALIQRLSMRGLEPLLPANWRMDFKTIPENLFTDNDEEVFISSASGRDFRGMHSSYLFIPLPAP